MAIFKQKRKKRLADSEHEADGLNARTPRPRRRSRNVTWRSVDISPEMFKIVGRKAAGDADSLKDEAGARQLHKGDMDLLLRVCDRHFIEKWKTFSESLHFEAFLPLGIADLAELEEDQRRAVYILTGYPNPPRPVAPFLKLEEWNTLKSIIGNQVAPRTDVVLLGTNSQTVRQAVDYFYYETEIRVTGEDNLEETVRPLSVHDQPEDPHQIKQARLWLRKAIFTGASDIHLEPKDESARVRFRVDGELIQVKDGIPLYDLRQMITWVKAQAGMDIAERRRPIDGRIKLSHSQSGEDRLIDVRISIIPTTHGQKMVMRLLDPETLRQLAASGLHETIWDEGLRAQFNSALKSRDGIVLVTGPTGSGKTTTLNAALFNLLDIYGAKRNIVTIEDPVEYNVKGVSQVQINEQADVTFPKTLRAMLRQDPDIVLVGEIRDAETASVAIQAALTGHLILATLHTNDALSAAERMQDLGASPFLIGSTVRILQAQRLVRMLCPQCGYDRPLDRDSLRTQVSAGRLAPYLDTFLDPGSKVYEADPQGCPKCNYTGFLGRTAVMEMASMTPTLVDGIERSLPSHELERLARKSGFRPMVENGIKLVCSGVEKNGTTSHTTLSEVEPIEMNIYEEEDRYG